MCYKAKCLFCIPVKPACFVLAIINAIIHGITLIWFSLMAVGALIAISLGGFSIKIGGVRFKRSIEDDVIFNYWIPFEYLLPICGLFSLLTFIFSVLLCYGIDKRRWKLVRVYFIYGCVITALGFTASIVQVTMPKPDLGYLGLFGCALHSLFLLLVHQTHEKLLEDAMFSNHLQLDDYDDTTDLI